MAGVGPARGVSLQRALDAYAIAVSIQAYDIAIQERGGTPTASNGGGSTPWPSRSSPDAASVRGGGGNLQRRG